MAKGDGILKIMQEASENSVTPKLTKQSYDEFVNAFMNFKPLKGKPQMMAGKGLMSQLSDDEFLFIVCNYEILSNEEGCEYIKDRFEKLEQLRQNNHK